MEVSVIKLRLIKNTRPTSVKLYGYKTYNFVDKDPVIDELRSVLRKKETTIQQLAYDSGVSKNTLSNWFHGETKRPQHATVLAVARAMGYDYRLVKQAERK